eukprot:769493-Pleurochrysis_carterae.AAC.1
MHSQSEVRKVRREGTIGRTSQCSRSRVKQRNLHAPGRGRGAASARARARASLAAWHRRHCCRGCSCLQAARQQQALQRK